MKKLLALLFVGLFHFGNAKDQVATFAGGCFWCVQHDFDQVDGVVSTTAGYTGGTKINPNYKEVSSGNTGHVESVQVVYDPDKVSYGDLLDFYFHNIDPTRDDGQFCDDGNQYRPVIFYHNAEQKQLAEKYKQNLIDSRKFPEVMVQIFPAQTFYPAEEYHQEYYQKNPIRYKYYRYNCGRDKRLKELWGHYPQVPFLYGTCGNDQVVTIDSNRGCL